MVRSENSILSCAAHIDRRSITHVVDVRRIVFLDQLDADATVFRNLIDLGSLHQPETDLGTPQALAGSGVALAIMLHAEFVEQRVEDCRVVMVPSNAILC
jgi:hypothetical protein